MGHAKQFAFIGSLFLWVLWALSAHAIVDDGAGKSNEAALAQMRSGATTLVSIMAIGAPAVQTAVASFESQQKSCVAKQAMAAKMCLENLSPKIAAGAGAVGLALGAGNALTSANGSCSTAAQIMDIGNKVLTAFTATCGGAKALCVMSCGSATKTLAAIAKAAAAVTCPPPPGRAGLCCGNCSGERPSHSRCCK